MFKIFLHGGNKAEVRQQVERWPKQHVFTDRILTFVRDTRPLRLEAVSGTELQLRHAAYLYEPACVFHKTQMTAGDAYTYL